MDKIKMLCTGDYEPEWFPKFEEIFDIERKGFSLGDGSSMIVLKGEELVECLAGKEICIIGYDAVTEDIIKKSADVKLLLSVRDGPEENIDIDACTAAGIPVISSAGRCAVSVAEFTFLLMLMLARPMVPVIEKIRSEGWTKQNSPSLRSMYAHQSTELYNKNLGIIGFGRNAKSLSVLANAFHMQVNAYDPYVSEEVMDSFHVKKMDLDQVVKTADYVIVLARLTPDTEGILSRELIFSMKPTASIVNTGRARLVDGEAILDALEQQVIKSAALDVHTPEPLGALSENRIYQIPEDRLIITSHAAGVTKERSWHQYHLLYKQLLEYFQGNIPEGCVNKQVFDTPQFKERGGKYFGIR
ncbi:MAG: D-3-phosphoglycerate dehydrogenase [Hungatella hathewayi]|nr:NAD(P)-dependent oxidoreductase [Hungatella hathewayi]MBS4983569.1 D-3-phosphoglycerate dehydrogenase [Hungatella hathewayi]